MSNKTHRALGRDRYPLLYLAYGANTQIDHMAHRCPDAVAVGVAKLHGYRLVFRGVADVIQREGSDVNVAVWEISQDDEIALDRFEGFPNLYVKRYARVTLHGKERIAMFYVMRGPRNDVYEPPKSYERTLREGYEQFGMPADQIDDAIDRASRSSLRRLTYKGKWLKKDKKEEALRPAANEPLTMTDEKYWEREFWRAQGYPDWYASI